MLGDPAEDIKTEAHDEPESRTFVRSLARGLGVIVAMGEKPQGMTLSEVAVAAGLDRATARRFLLTLQQLRYVIADGRRFMLAPRVLDLGYAYLSSMPLWEVASPYLRSLADQTNEACSIGVWDNGDVLYISRVQSNKRKMAMHVSIGTRFPAFCTSMGRVLLAALPAAELDAYLAALHPQQHTHRTVTDKTRIRETIEAVRAQGWSLADQEMEEGVRSISVPLHNRKGAVIAAMNISVQASRIGEAELRERHLPQLQLAAHEIDAVIRAR